MTRPTDAHFDLVDEQRSVERLERALEVLERSKIDFIVEGGWAVAAYGSRVPSVDLDVLVAGGLTEEVGNAIEDATGLQIFSHATTDALALDFVDADLPNGFINRPSLSYVPSRYLAGNTMRRMIPAGKSHEVPVPTAPHLAFMKLKAFHDRTLQWRTATGARHLLMTMANETQVSTMRRGADHWLRKAGKDLFDVSWLVHEHTDLARIEASSPAGMWEAIRESLDALPTALVNFAQDMAERSGNDDIAILGADR